MGGVVGAGSGVDDEGGGGVPEGKLTVLLSHSQYGANTSQES